MQVPSCLIHAFILILALVITSCQDRPDNAALPLFQIVFTSQTEGQATDLFLIDSDGSNLRQLTADPARDEQPRWSPDGQSLVFVSNRDGRWHIYLYEFAVDTIRQLTMGTYPCTEPDWSPDGSQIVFRRDSAGLGDIFSLNLDTNEMMRLTYHPAADITPAWSPDGNRIAFVSHRDGNGEIYVMDRDGSHQTRLTDNPRVDLEPTWSPDGNRLAFTSHRTPADEHVYILDLETGTLFPLDTPNSDEYSPVWSSDGTKVYFYNITHREIYQALAKDHATPERIFDFAKALDLSLSPDGEVLVFSAGIADSPSAVYTLYLKTGEFRRITDTSGPDRFPSVRPTI